MKKILTSIIMAIVIISSGMYALAAGTESTGQETESTTEKASATLKMSEEVKVEEGTKEVKIKIGYGELEGINDGKLVAFKGIITYSDEYFEQLTQENFQASAGYSATYEQSKKRLVVESTRTPKANEDVVEITLKLKENVKNVTTNVEFKLEEFTDSINDFELKTLKTNVTINSNTQNPSQTESTKEDDSNKTESTKDDDKKGELEIVTDSTKTNTTKTNTTKTDTTKDTTITPETKLPQTGVTKIALIILAIIVVGIISLIRYKNIEIK